MVTLTRKQLTDLGACGVGLEWFDNRAGGTGKITYPNGWDSTEITRLSTTAPLFFKWMAKKGLIPGVNLESAREIVREKLGLDAPP